jgi:hypothetical protein
LLTIFSQKLKTKIKKIKSLNTELKIHVEIPGLRFCCTYSEEGVGDLAPPGQPGFNTLLSFLDIERAPLHL